MIFLFLCLLPSAVLSMLTFRPFGFPPPRFQLRLRPHKQLCFDWMVVLSTGFFLNPSKCKASFFLVDRHQANFQPHLLLLNSHLRFNPTFLGVTFDRTLSFSKHVSLLKAKLFLRPKALCCISASSWGPSKESLSLLYKAFLRPLSHLRFTKL